MTTKNPVKAQFSRVVSLDETALKLSDVDLGSKRAIQSKQPPSPTSHSPRYSPNCMKHDLKVHTVAVPMDNTTWLDASLSFVPVYQELNGNSLSSTPSTQFYTVTESGHAGLKYATTELHEMFMKATEYVIEHEDEVGGYFHIPSSLWPKIRKSWSKNKRDVVSGRFDFALTDEGIKVYEYNADSASCLLECGYMQDAWSKGAGVEHVGQSCSDALFSQLASTWKSKQLDGPLHFMCDSDIEERYHASYMKASAEAAGIECILLVGLDDISRSDDGLYFQDKNGRRIQNVWKTWCWRTVMNQVEARELSSSSLESSNATKLQLMDILLHEDIRIFEPLWTLLAGSKAILPIMSAMYPDCPFLLRSSFEEKDVTSFRGGYVAKPVMGRTGSNISIYSADHTLLNETGGRWTNDTIVYQELAILPKCNDFFVQVNTWAVNGAFGGTVLRQDKSSIIGLNSDIPALRVVPDKDEHDEDLRLCLK